MSTVQELTAKAVRLDREAIEHKRAASYHRKKARAARQNLTDLYAIAAAHGFKVTLTTKGGDNNHGQTTTT